MATRNPRLSLMGALTALALTAACERHPLESKIEARNDLAFSLWLADQAGRLSAADRRDLFVACQQIKYEVMSDSPGLPPEEFTRAVYVEVDGHTAREVLLHGLEVQHHRIAREIEALEAREEHYQKINARQLSPDAREFLDGFMTRMTQRRAELQRLDDQKTLLLVR